MKKAPIDDKIEAIYQFLLSNRSYTPTVQRRFYTDALAAYPEPEDKLISLLYKIQATQSQPKLDNVAKFWKKYHKSNPSTFKELIYTIDGQDLSYRSLYQHMKKQASWGPKVSSLFTKAIYHIHRDERYSGLSFLPDAPLFEDNDQLYLPVDSVMIHFFTHIGFDQKCTFANINKYLQGRYPGKAMEVWDDLWFWGFIGQKGSGKRKPMWNESKFWAIHYVDKSKMNEVKVLVDEFIRLIGN